MRSKSAHKESFLQKIPITLWLIIIIFLIACVLWLGLGHTFNGDEKTTNLRFENIGLLETQVAYATVVENIENPRTFFKKFDIPFTKSHYIFSYDCILKAGIDFEKVDWKKNEEKKQITVYLPKAEIINTELDNESLKIYLEDESIFNQVTLAEINESQAKLKEQAQADAEANGFLENANENAKNIIKGFFAAEYDLNRYEIKFEYIK